MSEQRATASDQVSKRSIWLRCPVPKWARALGAAGFLFFLVKGLLWLSVPAAVVAYRGCSGQTTAPTVQGEPAAEVER